MALVKLPKEGDWIGLRQALHRLATIKLGTEASPTFLGLTVTSNVTVSTFDAASAVMNEGVISSFACASATISAASFVSVFATGAVITTLAVSSASVSALVVVSGFFDRAVVSSATIKRFLVGGITS